MIKIWHRCARCGLPWISFTSRRRPDTHCPFCGKLVALDGVWAYE